MLFFDLTRASAQSHHSGLLRVSSCLGAALQRRLGDEFIGVEWHARHGIFVDQRRRRPVLPSNLDWFLTPELFCEEERPGFSSWLARRPCRVAGLYHDAIPLQHPEWTWPRSVARHPHYLRLLSLFDAVFANSRASAKELSGYWAWAGFRGPGPQALELGADGPGRVRAPLVPGARSRSRSLLMLGIVEPRKNQAVVLDACATLWSEGADFSLTLAGRVNPHFGKPIVERVRRLARAGRPVRHHSRLDDAAVGRELAAARLLLMPSQAEGCGLPLLEALWAGVPVVCSDLPALLESARGGGCRIVPCGDALALTATLRELLADGGAVERLAGEAHARRLPLWDETAGAVLAHLAKIAPFRTG